MQKVEGSSPFSRLQKARKSRVSLCLGLTIRRTCVGPSVLGYGRRARTGVAKQQIREADEAIERANADLDDTIRQLGELGLLGRPASQQSLEKLTAALDDAHSARARLGDQGESD